MIVFEHTASAGFIWVAAVAAAALTAWTFYRWVRPPLISAVLVVLRIAFLALLAWCLFLPSRRDTLKQITKPRFVVALDASVSMLLSPPGSSSNRMRNE